ncbi:GntR family transcriptional regulator [Gracilibacillus alcaliphilus]|uniref:GntR family transcriptional regulator n=1 Tax=Gracilibacillus alcaliphilus TaxID=1401441 RepID=UPI00195CA7FF|nr:GntR family transcriptional regulator [Gracilibacillus alcaliphilus]MBM7676250.1 GntR family transcriptional regulator of bglA [Gracilibacillus alcaliphilus]
MLKYQQVANQIELYIEQHQLQQGTKLPVLESLMDEFSASKSTIIKALDLLEKKGLIFQVRGSGIFVRRKSRMGYINLLSNQGFKKDLEEFDITSEMLQLDVVKPTQEVADNLQIDYDQGVYYVKRIRYINGQTLCVEESYYDKSVVTYLNKQIVTESIFHYVTEGLGLNIGFSEMYIKTGKLTEEEANYLHLKQGDPKLVMESIFFLSNGKPFDFSKVTYNYEQSQFFLLGSGI